MLKPLPKYVFKGLLSALSGKYKRNTQPQQFIVSCPDALHYLTRHLPFSHEDEAYYLDGNGNFVEEGQAYAVKLQFMWSNQHFWVSA